MYVTWINSFNILVHPEEAELGKIGYWGFLGKFAVKNRAVSRTKSCMRKLFKNCKLKLKALCKETTEHTVWLLLHIIPVKDISLRLTQTFYKGLFWNLTYFMKTYVHIFPLSIPLKIPWHFVMYLLSNRFLCSAYYEPDTLQGTETRQERKYKKFLLSWGLHSRKKPGQK